MMQVTCIFLFERNTSRKELFTDCVVSFFFLGKWCWPGDGFIAMRMSSGKIGDVYSFIFILVVDIKMLRGILKFTEFAFFVLPK